ncbi:PREDICTED: zinc finger protein 560-like [Acromyrmex echinatior]|uniref:zinc finger protein 560-like n=1 Tax=Acromyrmex echinatior TaxID=103372 RepID=UPI000580FD4D|nr:PREDICTED: zinc finger protein 560-like [Acromyrmex echinatior]
MYKDEKLHLCEDCKRLFLKIRFLKKHKRRKHVKKECDDCMNGFDSEQELFDHLAMKHSDDSIEYECKICSLTFTRLEDLNIHMQMHTESQKKK